MGLAEAHKPIPLMEAFCGAIIHRFASGSVCKPPGAVVPERSEDGVACDLVKPDDLGDDTEVADDLAQVKLVCHSGGLLEVLCALQHAHISLQTGYIASEMMWFFKGITEYLSRR